MKPKFVVLLMFVLSMVSLTYSSELKRQNAFTKVDAPAIYYNQKALLKSASLGYNIYYSPDFPQEGIRDAIGKAMEIWSYILVSNKPIRISIKMADLGNDDAIASTETNFYNFPSGTNIQGVKLNFQYPMSLAKALADKDINEGFSGDEYYDMIITINSRKITSNEFSYDLFGEPVANKIDLVTIIMHEIGHGLGIAGSMSYDLSTGQGMHDISGYKDNTSQPFPKIFDDFGVVDAVSPNNKRLLNTSSYPNNSPALGSALISDNLYFDGPKSIAAAQNSLPKLYAPKTWSNGSSFSHLDEIKYPEGNSNSLMTYQSEYAEVIHSPGEVGLALLEDMGWKVNRLITVTSPVPDDVCKRGNTYQISWTDNKANAINIKLYKKNSGGTFDYVRLLSALNTTNVGANTLSWTLQYDITDGSYKIKMEYNSEIFGESGVFVVSDLNQVALPRIYPETRTYTSTIQIPVTIVCETSGAEIYYTTNGSDPTTWSTLYTTEPFVVTPPCTVKAVAYKSGMLSSNIASTVYSFTTNAVAIEKLDEQGQNFGVGNNKVAFWVGYWNYYSTPDVFVPQTYTIITDQNLIPNTSGVYQKFWKWMDNNGKNEILNWGTYDLSSANVFKAYFKTPYAAKIQNALEGFPSLTGDTLFFKDPWKYDKVEAKGNTNYGKMAPLISYRSPLIIAPTSNLKGVLLGINMSNTGTTYSAMAKTDVTINGIAGKFVDWSSDGKSTLLNPNSLESNVIFNATDANIYARYKCINRSNTSTAFSNSSQRKFIRTSEGYLHLVYESIDRVWYEMSTDNGVSWRIMNDGKPLSSSPSRLPSIASYGLAVAVVWQEKNSSLLSSIRIKSFYNNSASYIAGPVDQIVSSTYEDYSTELNPSVAWGNNARLLVLWENKDPYLGSLRYRYGITNGETLNWITEGSVPGSSGQSTHPAASADINPSSLNYFNIAWEEGVSPYVSIMYVKLHLGTDGQPDNSSQAVNLSYPYSYNENTSPSVTSTPEGGARVAYKALWVYDLEDSESLFESRVAFVNPDYPLYSDFICKYGGDVFSPQVNSFNDSYSTDSYMVAWTDFDGIGYYNVASESKNFRYKETLRPATGTSMQLNNGGTKDNMYVMAFETSSSPYTFRQSQPIGTIQWNKTKQFTEARVASIRKSGAHFFFALGDVTSEAIPVSFIKVKPPVKIKDMKDINPLLQTEPFMLKDNSSFSFGVRYGVMDSLKALSELKDGEEVSFRVELLDAETDSLIGIYTDVKMDRTSLVRLNEYRVKINTPGAKSRLARLRFRVESNFSGECALSSQFTGEGMLLKGRAATKEMDLNGSLKVTSYGISQNYPNPFNPSTTINYEVPVASKVTLKVYDMLGKEVSTLVNGYREMGRYSVQFNAKNLPSGTYIYEIRANDFVKSGKMMLLK